MTNNFYNGIQERDDFYGNSNLIKTFKNLSIKDFYSFGEIEVFLNRGQKFKRTGVFGSVYSVATTEYLIGITSLATAPNIGLPHPATVGAGKTFIIKDEAGGAATTTITVSSAGEKNIDGASTATITTNYGSKSFYCDGANWFTY